MYTLLAKLIGEKDLQLIIKFNNKYNVSGKNVSTKTKSSPYHGIGIIKFDNPVSIIPYWAFREKRNLKTIILPQNIQNIEDGVFTFCHKLEYFYGKFSSNDNRCLIVDGELKSLSPQISGEYTLPNTVNRLGHTCIASLQNICQIV